MRYRTMFCKNAHVMHVAMATDPKILTLKKSFSKNVNCVGVVAGDGLGPLSEINVKCCTSLYQM